MMTNSLVKPWIAVQRGGLGFPIKIWVDMAYNSWMMLSKLMTAKSRDAIAAPDISESAIMRKSEAVFATVAGEMFLGSG
jgi:hypothetical protein